MSLTTVSFADVSLAQVEQLLRPDVIRRYLRETKFGFYGTATSTGVSAGELNDTTRIKGSALRRGEIEGGWVRISYTTDSAAPVGEIRPIADYRPETGSIIVDPPFSAAPDSGDKYEVHRIIHPQDVLDFIDQICTEDVYLPSWSMCSDVPDFDFEASSTLEWTSTNSTYAKSTAEPKLSGRRKARVTNTSGNGYISTDNMNVDAGATYHLSALVRPTSPTNDAVVTLFDITNTATIGTAMSYTGSNVVRLWNTFTIPNTCERCTIRLGGTGAANVCDFDDVVFYRLGDRRISLPWWVRSPSQVKRFFVLSTVDTITLNNTQDTYAPDMHGRPTPYVNVIDDSFGRGQLQAQFTQGSLNDPLFFLGMRNEVAYTSDLEVKHIDSTFMHARLCYYIFASLMATPASSAFDSKWVREQRDAYDKVFKNARYAQDQRIARILTAQEPFSYYSRNDTWPSS